MIRLNADIRCLSDCCKSIIFNKKLLSDQKANILHRYYTPTAVIPQHFLSRYAAFYDPYIYHFVSSKISFHTKKTIDNNIIFVYNASCA